MVTEHVAIILTGLFTLISTVLAGWFAYNQKTKDRMTDLKIDQIKKESENKSAINNRHIAIIYGEMWDLVNKLEADRCFIIQPHPELKYLYISVVLEVDRKGISMAKDLVCNIPMNDIGNFSKELASNSWLYFDNIDGQVFDLRIRSLMRMAGSTNIAIRQLANINNEWIGSIVVENTKQKPLSDDAREIMTNIANMIQFILPPIN